MTFLARMRSLFKHDDDDERSTRVEAAFARVGDAQRRAGSAASEVRHAAECQAERLNSVRVQIQERMAEQQSNSRTGQTNEIRSLVEDMLKSMEPEPKSDKGRGPC